VGVDSGRAGVFDAGRYYDDSVFPDPFAGKTGMDKYYFEQSTFALDESLWERAVNQVSQGARGPWIVPHGVFSSSGWGDGCYWCLVKLEPLSNSRSGDDAKDDVKKKEAGDAGGSGSGIGEGDVEVGLTEEEKELKKRRIVAVRIVFMEDEKGEDEEKEDEDVDEEAGEEEEKSEE
jgi:hypothetical protein